MSVAVHAVIVGPWKENCYLVSYKQDAWLIDPGDDFEEIADFGITVNAVGPTPVKTEFIKHISEEKVSKLIARLPIKRLGEMEDILNVVEFLLNRKVTT